MMSFNDTSSTEVPEQGDKAATSTMKSAHPPAPSSSFPSLAHGLAGSAGPPLYTKCTVDAATP